MDAKAWTAVLVGAIAGSPAATARAFEIESSATHGCHERITADALRDAGWPEGARPPAPNETERRIIDDLLFELESLPEDPWSAALLIGARFADVGEESPRDFAALSQLHNDPARQVEHCLRRESDDGEAGDGKALAACRNFILDQLERAIGPGDDVDLATQIAIGTHLKFRAEVEIDVDRFAFHLGRALHALQDSYAHSFRNPDDRRVRHVLNWIEGNVGGSQDELRDGHPHVARLDDCSSGIAAERQVWATEASSELIAAVGAPAASRQERLQRARAVLDARFEIEPGCTADNGWCGAPEAGLSGCAAGGRGSGVGGALAVLGLLSIGWRGSRNRKRPGAAVAGIALALFAVARASAEPAAGAPFARASAEQAAGAPFARVEVEPSDEESPDNATERALDRDEKVIDAIPDRVTHTWGASLTAGAAIDRGGAAAAAGIRFASWESIALGLDIEYNPWISVADLDVAPGAVSVYVPLIWKLRRFGTWELRSTFGAGASMILFDLVGVDKGSIGPFIGWNPLGLAIPLGGDTKLIVKPGDISLPVPQVSGIPFYYHQYRFTLGIEWYP